jgi:hypothetical protein
MLPFFGLLAISLGAILRWSPLWFAEQNRRNLDRTWGTGNIVSKSLDAQKDPLQIYRRLGVFFMVFGALWTALAIVVVVRG